MHALLLYLCVVVAYPKLIAVLKNDATTINTQTSNVKKIMFYNEKVVGHGMHKS